MEPRGVTLDITDPGVGLINANHREHWTSKAARTRAWRKAAEDVAEDNTFIPQLGPVSVDVIVLLGYRARLDDATNVAPTVKACLDGIVAAHLIPDDRDKYIRGVEFLPTQRAPRADPNHQPPTTVRIVLTEVTEEPTA